MIYLQNFDEKEVLIGQIGTIQDAGCEIRM